MRRLLHVAMTRARKGLVLAWAEGAQPGATPRPSPFYEDALAALDVEEEEFEEELFGPAEGSTRPSGSCATSCSTRSRESAAGSARCGSTPTWTWTRRCRATSS